MKYFTSYVYTACAFIWVWQFVRITYGYSMPQDLQLCVVGLLAWAMLAQAVACLRK